MIRNILIIIIVVTCYAGIQFGMGDTAMIAKLPVPEFKTEEEAIEYGVYSQNLPAKEKEKTLNELRRLQRQTLELTGLPSYPEEIEPTKEDLIESDRQMKLHELYGIAYTWTLKQNTGSVTFSYSRPIKEE